jgi:hypothetical protein
MRRRIGGWVACGLLAVMLIGAGGCGGSTTTHRPVSSTTSVNDTVNAPMKVNLGTGSVAGPEPTTSVPTERGNPIPAGFSTGQDIIITSHGFEPRTLEANVSSPVVWTNLSGGAVRIQFIDFPVDSGTIPAGGTFTWSTANALALSYQSTTGWYGKLLMNPPTP